LGDLCDYGSCNNIKSSEIPNNAWILDLEDIEKDTAKLLQRVKKADRVTTSIRHSFFVGNVLYSKLRTYLNKVLVADIDGFCTTEILPLDFKGHVIPEYARHVLMSQMSLDYTAQCGYGVKMPRLGTTDGEKALFPLPPLTEQKRIVSVIESAFALIDEIESNKLSLSQFIKQIKSEVLELAIRGKLVPQDSNDEPASVLLEKIKTKKTTADILHYPFEVPEGWVWCRLGDIGNWSAGTTPSRTNSKYYKNATVPWLKTGDLNDSVITNVSEYISEHALNECKQLKLNSIGSVVIALYGATIGKCGILNLETTTNQACCVCKTYPIVFNKYLFYFLLSQREQFRNKAEGGAQPNISKEKIVNSLLPLPPLSEQHRIVQKIETIFQALDSIQNNLLPC